MVFPGVSERERPAHKFMAMAMAPERSRPLHNFNMPCLRWGNQKLLRCMKVNSDGEIPSIYRRSPASESESEGFIGRRRDSDSTKQRTSNGFENFTKLFFPRIGAYGEKSEIEEEEEEDDVDDGIAEVRAKLMYELRSAANKINVSIPDEGKEDESESAARPWNLRTRRSACRAPNDSGREGFSNSKNKDGLQNSPPPPIKSLRLRGSSPAQGSREKKKRPKFSIFLSRQEIDDDFLFMTGGRPSRKPKKRPRIVQKQLDTIFPGFWLSEITTDSYKVDIPESGKR